MEPGLRRALAGLPMGEPPPGFGLPATLLIPLGQRTRGLRAMSGSGSPR